MAQRDLHDAQGACLIQTDRFQLQHSDGIITTAVLVHQDTSSSYSPHLYIHTQPQNNVLLESYLHAHLCKQSMSLTTVVCARLICRATSKLGELEHGV